MIIRNHLLNFNKMHTCKFFLENFNTLYWNYFNNFLNKFRSINNIKQSIIKITVF